MIFRIANFTFQATNHRFILKNINLTLYPGKYVSLTGKSGCGKSTFFKCLIGQMNIMNSQHLSLKTPVDQLPVLFFGDRNILKINDWMRHNPKLVQIISQDFYKSVNPRSTLEQDLMHFCESENEFFNLYKLDYLFRNLRMEYSLLNKRYALMSGGQRQRSIIAMTLFINPHIIFFDEIFSALDFMTKNTIINFFRRLKRTKEYADRIFFFITHDLQILSDLCDKFYIMQDGSIPYLFNDYRDFLANLPSIYNIQNDEIESYYLKSDRFAKAVYKFFQ